MLFMPAVFSKFKTLDSYKKALIEAPKQEAGSKEAFERKVFEIHQVPMGPVATLSEIYEFSGMTKVDIRTNDGYIITVSRSPDAKWSIINVG